MNFYLKEIRKEEIAKLVKAGVIKNTGKGFVSTKYQQPIGLVKTVHGRHYYIEDFYADMAKRLK